MTLDNDVPQASARSRGRPTSGSKQQNADRLLETTDRLLKTHSHLDLTEQKIAQEAGIDKSMIHYYFGSKDGLLFELVRNVTDECAKGIAAINFVDPISARSITRQTIKVLTEVYYSKPWIARVMVAELTRSNSVIRRLYLERCGPQGLAVEPIRRLLVKLIDMGIYDSNLNVGYATRSILFMITAPLLMAQFPSDFVVAIDEYKTDAWIDHITDLFDRQLRKEKAGPPNPDSRLTYTQEA